MVSEACKGAPLEDAPAVYEAMRHAGVPEYLSFASAVAVMDGKKGPMELRAISRNTAPVKSLPGRYNG